MIVEQVDSDFCNWHGTSDRAVQRNGSDWGKPGHYAAIANPVLVTQIGQWIEPIISPENFYQINAII
jgi:hypothetical protein